ncbi:hypothetical protein PR003_g18310 [Phytophthora rubi]|nr:hypothetical protein PR001_g14124 [Phytophthora rubi]KAE9318155.1 hypothetical protein PR003_g18310 [Phytophthora rubi]
MFSHSTAAPVSITTLAMAWWHGCCRAPYASSSVPQFHPPSCGSSSIDRPAGVPWAVCESRIAVGRAHCPQRLERESTLLAGRPASLS